MRRHEFLLAGAAAGVAASVLPPAALGAEVDDLTDRTLATKFRFAGMDTTVDGIQTAAAANGNAIFTKATDLGGDGVIVVTVDYQNPSASDVRSTPGAVLGFEFKDGSQMDEAGPAYTLLSPTLVDPPDELHPKQHVKLIYVMTGWKGQPITKMFFKRNSGGEGSDGYQYVRFQVRPEDVTALSG